MRVHLPYNNHRSRRRNLRPELRGAAGRKSGMRIDLAPSGKKILPIVRSGFGPVPPPLRAEIWPKDQVGSQFLSTFQFSAPA